MIRLHLLGITPDLKGLVYSGRKGGKAGTYWLPVDEEFLRALASLDDARTEASKEVRPRKGRAKPEAGGAKSAKSAIQWARLTDDPSIKTLAQVSGSIKVALPPSKPRPDSKLTPREIQQLFREGRSVRDVSALAGVDEAYASRFLGPVVHEMLGVVRMTRHSFQSRARRGQSGLPVGEAVIINLQERRATDETLDALDDGWEAKRMRSGVWRVRLRFSHRGKRRAAEWEFVKESREVRPRNDLARQLGWSSEQPVVNPAIDAPAEIHPAEAEAAEARAAKSAPTKSTRSTKPAPVRAKSAPTKSTRTKSTRTKSTRTKSAPTRPSGAENKATKRAPRRK